jgi:hypothetical protein
MALIGLNGGLIGSRRSANVGAASGLWTANEQVVLKRAGLWAVVSDSNAVAYIAAVEAADGQPLEDGVKSAINSFILGCKADGIWTAIKASCILAGARTLSGALVPLVGTAPTNNNFVSGDYNRETGLVGDGSTKYLDSNRNNNADPQDNQHMCVYPTAVNAIDVDRVYMGTGFTATGSTYFFTRTVDAVARNRSATANTGLTRGAANALIGLGRNTSASFTYQQSGSSSSVTRTSETPADGNVFVYQSNGYASFSNARLAFYSIGESLNLALLDARVTTLINAIAAAIP